MSSLLSKLMTLVRSSVRGTHSPGRVARKPARASQEPSARAEVDQASTLVDQTQDAADVHASRSPENPPLPQTLRAEEPKAATGPPDELEEDRIVDLLRGKQS